LVHLGEMVTEFKIKPDDLSRRREFRVRLLSWGTVAVLIATTALLFTLGVNGVLSGHSFLRFLFVFTLLGAIIGASILASREALRLAEREMVFVLEDSGIVKRRKGWPDEKIDFSDIDTVREELRWLVIYSTGPRRKIAIPNNVAGFETIRAELVTRHLVFVRAKVSSRSFALPAISILSWAAVLLFRDVTVVIAAGARFSSFVDLAASRPEAPAHVGFA
jgi:hypothetical protein